MTCSAILFLWIIYKNKYGSFSISECGIKSVKNNSFINAQLEMKNLKLNQNKCHNIHAGKNSEDCVKLKAHEDILLNVESDKYVWIKF